MPSAHMRSLTQPVGSIELSISALDHLDEASTLAPNQTRDQASTPAPHRLGHRDVAATPALDDCEAPPSGPTMHALSPIAPAMAGAPHELAPSEAAAPLQAPSVTMAMASTATSSSPLPPTLGAVPGAGAVDGNGGGGMARCSSRSRASNACKEHTAAEWEEGGARRTHTAIQMRCAPPGRIWSRARPASDVDRPAP